MNPSASQRPDDATLVAWLDGELPAAAADQVARKVHDSDDLASRVRLLRASRAELAWALGESEHAPPPAPLAQVSRARPRFGLWLLVAAALTIVVTIGYWRPDDRAEADENDLLAVRLTAPRAGWDLFSGIRFTLSGHAKTATPCRVVARQKDETDAQMAARAVAENSGQTVVPIVLQAELTGPDRRVLGNIARVEGTFTGKESSLSIELVDLQVQYDGIAPLLTMRLDEDRPRMDFKWGFARGVATRAEGESGFVPEEIGEYRLSLRLRALPTSNGEAPAFHEPLEVAIGFAVRGIVGQWSEPVDGMRARIVASSQRPAKGQPLAIALQLRNDSNRARKFNVTGSTMAKIPQPFHFNLMVDGQEWQQRKRLGLITYAVFSGLPQPVSTVRSMIVLADYWHLDGTRPSALIGSHQVAIHFHFKPSVWQNNDKVLWIGKIDTPPVTIEFGSKR